MGILDRIKQSIFLVEENDKPAERQADKEVSDSLLAFKVAMLKSEPFYGDVLMRLNIIADRSVPTACTNGRWIRYNPDFMASLKAPQRNYVLLHEMLHVVLKHWKRQGKRDQRLWNIACDLVVNSFIDQRMSFLMVGSKRWSPYAACEAIQIERPPEGIFSDSFYNKNAEEAYQELYKLNKDNASLNGKGKIRVRLRRGTLSADKIPADLILSAAVNAAGELDDTLTEKMLDKILRDAVSKAAGRGRCSVPDIEIALVESKRLPWDRILADFLESRVSEESSYFTPERKYLHMDMIVPGLGSVENELTELWAFVDSSGSIRTDELGQFLTQLSRIAKQFNSVINLAYWDTEVGRVYKNIKNTKELLEAMPDSSGGTDVNCVYRYIYENRIKPGVLLILTDGYFGRCMQDVSRLRKKTIVVLSENSYEDEAAGLGRLARLKRERD